MIAAESIWPDYATGPISIASMEPLRDRSGEHLLQSTHVHSTRRLQWSRCVIAAESMSRVSGARSRRMLQWSRCVIAAESGVHFNNDSTNAVSLQWSRCVIAAESDFRGRLRLRVDLLQWSRCVIAAESA